MNKEKLLTIGMATYDDYDGVYFTIQSLRLHHPICQTKDVEFVVIDNNPKGKHAEAVKKLMDNIGGKYVPYEKKKSSFVKYEVPNHSSGKYILTMDCHVLLVPNAIDKLLEYYDKNPDCNNLIQGPMVSQSLNNFNSHWDPVFRGHMFGIWSHNPEAYKKGEPFEIPMLGMGLFSFKKSSFKGINPHFRGFGGEEGYIHEKFRQWGGRVICLPDLKWIHRFDRPNGVPFPLTLEDRVFNYFLGYLEIYNDIEHKMIKDIYHHFKDKLPNGVIDRLLNQAKTKIF